MSSTIAPAVKVEIPHAEIIRKILLKNKLLRTDLKIKKDQKNIYLPIKNKKKLKKELSKNYQYYIIESIFENQHKKIKSYKDLIKLPEELHVLLPTSYDVIGSIIVIKLDNMLIPYKNKIGEALLQTNSNVKSIYGIKAVEGEYRTRLVYYIGGEKKRTTIHKEYGLQLEIDIAKTFFNPRLATERKYIASLVQPGEIILDMFTGIAPMPIVIAKYAKPNMIIAVDKNKKAIEFAKKNIMRNKILTHINLICDDALNIPRIIDEYKIHPNRIIMNLPFHGHDFFTQALQCIYKKAMIHFYIIGNTSIISKRIQLLHKIAVLHDFNIIIEKKREIKSYAPHEFYMGIDITAEKNK
jgi:tRNA (guanine37-N1)-methyltransferase